MSRSLSSFFGVLVFACLAAPQTRAGDLSGYSGAQLYERFCASCHGATGAGDGPVAPFFRLKLPDLRRIARRHGGEFPADKIRRIIDGRTNVLPHGAREMPVWGFEFIANEGDTPEAHQRAEQAIQSLVDYLRSLQAH